MKNDFEKLLEKVAIPVGRPRRLGWFDWKKLANLYNKLLRNNFAKIMVVIAIMVVFIFIINGKMDEAIKIQNGRDSNSVNELIKKVSELTMLPDETPIIVTVSDISKLQNNLFFKDSANGNKLLVFQKSDKAVLYDPDKNIIVNFGKVEDVGVNLQLTTNNQQP